MADPTTSGLRRALAAILILALTLSGVGRSLASTTNQIDAPYGIAGVTVPICHSGTGEAPTDPGGPAGHDCCDACALLAPIVLPAPPFVATPAPVAHSAVHARAVAWTPIILRPRSPRQSQGPPAA